MEYLWNEILMPVVLVTVLGNLLIFFFCYFMKREVKEIRDINERIKKIKEMKGKDYKYLETWDEIIEDIDQLKKSVGSQK